MTNSVSQQKIETTILNNLIFNEEYTRKVIPFIKEDYFQDGVEKVLFRTITSYVEKYKINPELEALALDLQKVSFNEEQFKAANAYLDELKPSKVNLEWLLNETEKWCKDKAIYNAVLSGIHIIDGQVKDVTPDAIPTIISEALAVSLDSHVDHDYMKQSEDRYDFYHNVED